MSTHEQRGVVALPVIQNLAKHYDLDASGFVFTFKTMAMPPNSSDAEFVACCLVAREHGLNPLTKEIYFMKTRAGAIQPIVSVDGWIKKCNQHPQFDGMKIEDDRDAEGKLIGMFCTIYRKDRSHPTRIREDLAECKAVGGPVWKTSEYRMMRNRVICQCARIAFGFAGIMEPDEFDAMQRQMRDITPTVEAAPALPDIPDIPDEPASQDEPEVDQLADQEGLLAKLSEDRGFCQTEAELGELRESNADMIARLSPANQKRAAAILADEEAA